MTDRDSQRRLTSASNRVHTQAVEPPTRVVITATDGATAVCSPALLEALLAGEADNRGATPTPPVSSGTAEQPAEPKTRVWRHGSLDDTRTLVATSVALPSAAEPMTILEPREARDSSACKIGTASRPNAGTLKQVILGCVGVIAVGCIAAGAWRALSSHAAQAGPYAAETATGNAPVRALQTPAQLEAPPPSAAMLVDAREADPSPPKPSSDDRAVTTLAAATALAAGRHEAAVRMYESLSRAHPEQRAYAVIARLLARQRGECRAIEGAPCR